MDTIPNDSSFVHTSNDDSDKSGAWVPNEWQKSLTPHQKELLVALRRADDIVNEKIVSKITTPTL